LKSAKRKRRRKKPKRSLGRSRSQNRSQKMKKICSNFKAGEYDTLITNYGSLVRKLSNGLKRMDERKQMTVKGIQMRQK